MRCQKCGYVSFDHLSACKKCGDDATASRAALGLVAGKPTMPFFLGALTRGGQSAPVVTAKPETAPEDADGLFAEIDFGSDDLGFELTEETSPVAEQPSAVVQIPPGPVDEKRPEELDELEVALGSVLDDELALDMSDLDEAPSASKVKTDDFELDFTLEDPKPAGSATASASPVSSPKPATPEADDLSLDLDSDFEIELDLGELSPPPPVQAGEPETAFARTNGDDLVIDLGDDDLHGLLQELEDHTKGAKAVL